MADTNDEGPEGETPMQRALRLKKAAQAKAGPPGGKLENERVAAARSQSKSRPWMKR
jgi:hypothetical protein